MKEPRYQKYTPLNFYGNAYDAMWVVAYGLNTVENWARNKTYDDECEQNYPGELVTLDSFNHTNRRMGCYMRKAFHKVDIVGITVSTLKLFSILNSLLKMLFSVRDQLSLNRMALDLKMS